MQQDEKNQEQPEVVKTKMDAATHVQSLKKLQGSPGDSIDGNLCSEPWESKIENNLLKNEDTSKLNSPEIKNTQEDE